MPSLLDRELRLLAHVDLGEESSGEDSSGEDSSGEDSSGEKKKKKKKQPFKTDILKTRTRGRKPRNYEEVDSERDESGPTQDVSAVETPTNLTRPKDDPLDDDEAVIKFFSVLKAPCFFAQCTHRRTFTHSLHTRERNRRSLTNMTRSRHHTNRRRGDRPEQAHQ